MTLREHLDIVIDLGVYSSRCYDRYQASQLESDWQIFDNAARQVAKAKEQFLNRLPQGETRMSQFCTASHLQTMGASPEQAKALGAFAVPTSFLDFLKLLGEINWPGLLAFCTKYIGVLPAFFTACSSVPAFLTFAMTEVEQFPKMIADFPSLLINPPTPVVAA